MVTLTLTVLEATTLADLISFELESAGKNGEYDPEYVAVLESLQEKLP